MQRIIYLDTCMIDPLWLSTPRPSLPCFLGVRLMPTQELVSYICDWLMPTQLSSTMIMPVIDASVIYPLGRYPCKWKLASLESSNNNPQRHRKANSEDERPPIHQQASVRTLCVYVYAKSHVFAHIFGWGAPFSCSSYSGKMLHVLAVKHDNLSSSPGTHIAGERQLTSCSLSCTCPQHPKSMLE